MCNKLLIEISFMHTLELQSYSCMVGFVVTYYYNVMK